MKNFFTISTVLALSCLGAWAQPQDRDALDLNPVSDTRKAEVSDQDQNVTHLIDVTEGNLLFGIYTDGEKITATLKGFADAEHHDRELKIPQTVTYNGEKVPVTVVGDMAFAYSNIDKIALGSNIAVIGTDAFAYCRLTELTIPFNVTHIMAGAFRNNPVTSVVFENPSKISNPLFLGGMAFAYTKLTSFEIPARLKVNDESSFAATHSSFLWGTRTLREITINRAFTEIKRNYTFEILNKALCYCYYDEEKQADTKRVVAYPPLAGVKDFALESGYIDVFDGAMEYANLNSVTLTSTLQPIEGKVNLVVGAYAFADSGISSLNLNANGPIKCYDCFAAFCDNLEAYTLSDNITNIKVFDGVMYGKKDNERYLVSYPAGKRDDQFKVDDDVRHIANHGFFSNRYIKDVSLPDGLLTIKEYAFGDCTGLQNVDYKGEALTSIEDRAFLSTDIKEIHLPESITFIGREAFNTISAMREVSVNRITPPDGPTNKLPRIFSESTLQSATLVIPLEADPKAFTQTPGWEFVNVEKRDLAGIDRTASPEPDIIVTASSVYSQSHTPFGLYRIDGTALGHSDSFRNLPQGIYIINTDSRTLKIAI